MNPMRICIIYDCLFPYTIGGAERFYRNLAERLAARGHEVTYLTMRQWAAGEPPSISGVEVHAVAPNMPLYVDGRRRIAPPIRFGLGVFAHLLRHGRRYDHVHLASFPYFSLLAAGALRSSRGYTIGVDWHEVWTRDYWCEYLGPLGAIGWWVQRMCAALQQRAFAFSRLHLQRLAAIGCEGILLPGEYAGAEPSAVAALEPPTFIYAGRLIPEKRVGLLLEAFALAHAERPELRLRIFGQGPEGATLQARAAELHLLDALDLPGFVSQAELDSALASAAAIIQPSSREGYGMVVVEASAMSVPAIVVEAIDNAAVELVDEGENGVVASATPNSLAKAMLTLASDMPTWRQRTGAWYTRNRVRLSFDNSMDLIASAIRA